MKAQFFKHNFIYYFQNISISIFNLVIGLYFDKIVKNYVPLNYLFIAFWQDVISILSELLVEFLQLFHFLTLNFKIISFFLKQFLVYLVLACFFFQFLYYLIQHLRQRTRSQIFRWSAEHNYCRLHQKVFKYFVI